MKKKAGGVDNISATTIKTISEYVIKPLEHIFNLSIQQAIWPKALKQADIVPIYKSGDNSAISNYRPISLTSNIAKIFEKIIYSRLYNFIMKHKIISDKQFGFMRKRGTKDALNCLTNIIYRNLDKSKPIVTAFLDLAKAFDTVDHSILLDKLERYGVRGEGLKLLTSYLSDRKQCVKISDCKSEYKEITIGVPQGTILGPLFFILYVNDLLIDMQNETILSYADDTVIISCDSSWTAAHERLNEYLRKVAIWLNLNKLSLNVSKTVYIAYGN